MSAPYDDGPLPDEEFRPCYVCFRPDCPGHRPAITSTSLTEEQIYDAAARLVAPLTVCFRALAEPGPGRGKAREEIAWLLSQESRS